MGYEANKDIYLYLYFLPCYGTMDFALSNKYLEVIIYCLEPQIVNEKVEVLFDFYCFTELNFYFHIKYLLEIV